MKSAFKGPALLVTAMFMFAAMGIFVKSAGKQVPTSEIVVFRCLASMIAIFGLSRKEKISLKGNRRGLLFLRGAFGTAALFMFFYAMTRIPVADTILLNQTAPVFILPLAALFLKEKISARHVFFVATALVGVAFVIKPQGDMMNYPAFLALFSAVFSAFAYMLIRKLTETEHPLTIVYWFNMIGFLAAVPVSVPVFVMPSLSTSLDLLAMGVLATLGQIFMTFAYRYAEAGRLAVMGSFGALFGALFDYLALNHLPDAVSAAGGLLVIISCTLIQVDFPGRKNPRKERIPLP